MAALSHGRDRVAAGRLHQVASQDLYRRNPFRVVGLATDAKPVQVRGQRHLLLGALELGGGTIPGDRRLPLAQPPTAQEVRAAFDALERPDHRLVDELFWWWGEPGACGCPEELHELHDIAVEAHAKALDVETDDDLWIDAADAWMDALDHAGFWGHVRHRMKVLSDRRMDESTVDGLRAALPKALLAPQVALAGTRPGVARLLETWDVPQELVDDARRTAAAPTTARIDALIEEVAALLDSESARAAAQRVGELPALANVLEALASHERYPWSARQRNRIAIMLNNCGLAMENVDRQRSRDLIGQALALVVEPRDRETIQRNLAQPHSSWQFQVIEQVKAGNRGEALRILERLRRQADPGQRAEIDAMLNQLTVQSSRPHLWPLNLTLFALFVAAVVTCVAGLFDASTWVSVVATVVLSWAPFGVIRSEWYRTWISGTTSCVIGIVAFIVGWNAIGSLPAEALTPFLWSAGAFVLASPFAYGATVAWADQRSVR